MSDDESEPSRPEAYLLNSERFADGDTYLRFVMPELKKGSPNAATGYIIETVQLALKARKNPFVETVQFVALKHGVTFAVSIAASQLLDVAIIEMLDTVGDTAMQAAVRTLREADDVDNEMDIAELYRDARVLLRLAFEGHVSALGKRKMRHELISPYGDIELHGKAAQSALTIALINWRITKASGGTSWLKHAEHHFEAYESGERRRCELMLPIPIPSEASVLLKMAISQRNYNGAIASANAYMMGRTPAKQRLAELEKERSDFAWIISSLTDC